jgi:CubicO group peptidase (beta-lactamase class C family)
MDLAAKLDSLIPAMMEEHDIAGVSVARIEDGGVAWSQGFGVKCAESGEAVDTSTVFEAASLSKPVFAQAFLGLVDAGRITLDTRLSDVVDEPFAPDDPRAAEITVRHALSHSGGFPNWRGEEPLRTGFQPGSGFQYSGEGYVYLSRVAEAMTGRPVHEWLRDAVLTPLGMEVSSFVWEDRFEDTATPGHGWEREVVETWKGDTPNVAWSLHSTPTEFAKVAIAMMDPPTGSTRVITDGTRRESLRPQVVAEGGISWGLGWGLATHEDRETAWHWGETNSFTCFVVVEPAERRGLVVMTNSFFGVRVSQAAVRVAVGYEHPAFSSSLVTVW